MTKELHNDRDSTIMEYDMAGNVHKIRNAGTGMDTAIIMEYNFKRLVQKKMPTTNSMYGVTFEYGHLNDSVNGAGRIVRILQGDSMVASAYQYDELGNLIYEQKNIYLPSATKSYTTKYSYDSWGRALDILYPDGELLRYHYKTTGELEKIDSKLNGETGYVNIVKDIAYDGFGNMGMMTYGNDAKTTYTYNGKTQRLTNIKLDTKVDPTHVADILNKVYTYDAMGRVTKVENNPSTYTAYMTMGGSYTNNYSYDAYNRLDSATALGTFIGTPTSNATYSLAMTYNKAGGILSKTQSGADLNTNMNYGFDYTYDNENPNSITNKKHQLFKIADNNTSNTIPDTTGFAYSKAGSIRAIAVYKTSLAAYDTTERFVRNEEQLLMGYEKTTSGALQSLSHFVYDHTGTRILKGGLTPAYVATNGQSGSMSLSIDPYTIYVNPYYVVEHFSNNDKISKHYYMGMQRIATNLGNVPIPMEDPGMQKTNSMSSPLIDNMVAVLNAFGKQEGTAFTKEALAQSPAIEDYYPQSELPFASYKTDEPTTGQTHYGPGDPGETAPSARMLFYYHPDYLGNVEYITDLDGIPHQYFWYSPWGEALKDQKSNTNAWESPYAFNGKELDEETGLYYYGARYYNPQVSVWLSVDPKSYAFPNVTPYSFNMNNPIMMIDPGGDSTFVVCIGDGQYSVHSAETVSKDRGVYEITVDKKGKRTGLTGNKLGNSKTTHSFIEGKSAVVGAVIDMNSREGQDFIDEIIEDDPNLFFYAVWPKTGGTGGYYDLKERGIQDLEGMDAAQYRYRGSVDANGEIGSARDYGNIGAGIVAGRWGVPWEKARARFDGYEGGPENEESQSAQKIGWDIGHRMFIFNVLKYSRTRKD